MDSPIINVQGAVNSIVQDFSKASELFQRWRNGRAGKKAVAQEECKNSLLIEKSKIEETFNRSSLQHGAKFNRGDKCLDCLLNTKTNFQESVVNVLIHAVVGGKITKTSTADPGDFIRMSVVASRNASEAMNALSRRILLGTVGTYTTGDPGDALPHMPLRPSGPARPPRPHELSSQSTMPYANASQTSTPTPQFSQASFATTSFGSVNLSQSSLGSPFAPTPMRNNVYMSNLSWKPPELGMSQALVRTRPSSSAAAMSSSAAALSWVKDNIFPTKPARPYYDIDPLKPTPAVIPSFSCEEDTSDVLEESRRATAMLWDSADSVENDKLRRQAHSAPIPQEPWKRTFGIDDEDEESPPDSPLYTREPTPPLAEGEKEDKSQKFLGPVLLPVRPSWAQGGRRIRSEPTFEFSIPAPRVRRNVSGSK